MDLHIITALWCELHPLDFSSKITGINVSCISTHLLFLLTPICALKKRKHRYNLSHIHTDWGVFTAPRVCPWFDCRQPPLLLLWHFIYVWQSKEKPSTYGNLSYHDGGETLILALDSPRAAALLQGSRERESKSASVFSLWPGCGWKVSSSHIAQEEFYFHAKSPMSWLNVPLAHKTTDMHFWTGW